MWKKDIFSHWLFLSARESEVQSLVVEDPFFPGFQIYQLTPGFTTEAASENVSVNGLWFSYTKSRRVTAKCFCNWPFWQSLTSLYNYMIVSYCLYLYPPFAWCTPGCCRGNNRHMGHSTRFQVSQLQRECPLLASFSPCFLFIYSSADKT